MSAYWEARAEMIEHELQHMRYVGRSTNDPWLNRLRAAHAVDADFAVVIGQVRAAWGADMQVRP